MLILAQFILVNAIFLFVFTVIPQYFIIVTNENFFLYVSTLFAYIIALLYALYIEWGFIFITDTFNLIVVFCSQSYNFWVLSILYLLTLIRLYFCLKSMLTNLAGIFRKIFF